MSAELHHEQLALGPAPEIPTVTTVELLLVGGEQQEIPSSLLRRDVPMLGAILARKFEATYKPMGAEDRDIARQDARTASVRLLFKTYGLTGQGKKSDSSFDEKYKAIEKNDSMQDRNHIADLADKFDKHKTQAVFNFMMRQTTDKALLESIVTMRKASLLLLEDNSAG